MGLYKTVDIEEIVDSIKNSKSITFLLGSAISVPSGAPSVPDILENIEKKVNCITVNSKIEPDISDIEKRKEILEKILNLFNGFWKYSSNIPFEELIFRAKTVWDDLDKIIENTFNKVSKPTWNHEAISFLREKLIETADIYVVTTNWDILLEKSLNLPEKDKNNGWKIKNKPVYLYKKKYANHSFHFIKLHGSVEKHDIATLLKDLARLSDKIQDTVKNFLNSDTVIFAGYSASDIDIRPEIFKKKNNVWWYWIEYKDIEKKRASSPFQIARNELFEEINAKPFFGDLFSPDSPLVQIAQSFGDFKVNDNVKEDKITLELSTPLDVRRVVAFIGNLAYWTQYGNNNKNENFAKISHDIWGKHLKCDVKAIPAEQRIQAITEYGDNFGALEIAVSESKNAENDFEKYSYACWIPWVIGLIYKSDGLPRIFSSLNIKIIGEALYILYIILLKKPNLKQINNLKTENNLWLRKDEFEASKKITIAMSRNVWSLALHNMYRIIHQKIHLNSFPIIDYIAINYMLNIQRETLEIVKDVGDFRNIQLFNMSILDFELDIKPKNLKKNIKELDVIRHMFLATEKIDAFVESSRVISRRIEKNDPHEALKYLNKALEIAIGKIEPETIIKINNDIDRIKNNNNISI